MLIMRAANSSTVAATSSVSLLAMHTPEFLLRAFLPRNSVHPRLLWHLWHKMVILRESLCCEQHVHKRPANEAAAAHLVIRLVAVCTQRVRRAWKRLR